MVRKERRREAPNPMIQKVREPQHSTPPAEGHPQWPAGLRLDAAPEPPSHLLSPRPSDQAVHEGEGRVRTEQQRR